VKLIRFLSPFQRRKRQGGQERHFGSQEFWEMIIPPGSGQSLKRISLNEKVAPCSSAPTFISLQGLNSPPLPFLFKFWNFSKITSTVVFSGLAGRNGEEEQFNSNLLSSELMQGHGRTRRKPLPAYFLPHFLPIRTWQNARVQLFGKKSKMGGGITRRIPKSIDYIKKKKRFQE